MPEVFDDRSNLAAKSILAGLFGSVRPQVGSQTATEEVFEEITV